MTTWGRERYSRSRQSSRREATYDCTLLSESSFCSRRASGYGPQSVGIGGVTSKPNPIKLRVQQAARLKWEKISEITEDGQDVVWSQRSVRFVRGKEEAILWHKDATVTLVRDYAPPTLDDFVELEQWYKKRTPEMGKLTMRPGSGCISGRSRGLSYGMDTLAASRSYRDGRSVFHRSSEISKGRISRSRGPGGRCGADLGWLHPLQERSKRRAALFLRHGKEIEAR